jgi:hypothetical protein
LQLNNGSLATTLITDQFTLMEKPVEEEEEEEGNQRLNEMKE